MYNNDALRCQQCRLPDSSLQPVHGETLSPVLTFPLINASLSTLHYITSVITHTDDDHTHTHICTSIFVGTLIDIMHSLATSLTLTVTLRWLTSTLSLSTYPISILYPKSRFQLSATCYKDTHVHCLP